MNPWIFIAAFLASAVEFVEALTIILAVGKVHGRRTASLASIAGIIVLTLLILTFGPLLIHVPLKILQAIIGTLLLLFGMRWLRKAILRSAGKVSLHDEGKIFQTQLNEQEKYSNPQQPLNIYGFTTAFNGVFLEGLEAVIIVLTMGTTGQSMFSAIVGALAGLVVVLLIGFLVRKPLTLVPENQMKLLVSLILSSFGTLWVGEAMGVHWWLKDLFIPILFVIYWVYSTFTALYLKKQIIKG